MATNDSRSMNADFAQGSVDNTYISLNPNRGGEYDDRHVERMTWPTYAQAERHMEPPHGLARATRAHFPRETQMWNHEGDPSI